MADACRKRSASRTSTKRYGCISPCYRRRLLSRSTSAAVSISAIYGKSSRVSIAKWRSAARDRKTALSRRQRKSGKSRLYNRYRERSNLSFRKSSYPYLTHHAYERSAGHSASVALLIRVGLRRGRAFSAMWSNPPAGLTKRQSCRSSVLSSAPHSASRVIANSSLGRP